MLATLDMLPTRCKLLRFPAVFCESLRLRDAAWRVPKTPGANPRVAERAAWRSSQSCVTRGSAAYNRKSLQIQLSHFFCTPGNPCATPIVTCGEGSFSYQGVSTRGVRHSPGCYPQDQRKSAKICEFGSVCSMDFVP